MDADSQQAKRYRMRAVEVRVIADGTRCVQSRKILQGVADDYDRMARCMEAIAASDDLRHAECHH